MESNYNCPCLQKNSMNRKNILGEPCIERYGQWDTPLINILSNRKKLTKLIPCGCIFHTNCICGAIVVDEKNTCPLCDTKLYDYKSVTMDDVK